MAYTEKTDHYYKLPTQLNPFQKKLYRHLIQWKWHHITTEPGIARGREYDAILPDHFVQSEQLPHIYPTILDVLASHRKMNDFRIHQHFYHMASSQAANINLFLPLLHHPEVDTLFRSIKPDFASLAKDHLDQGYCIEYWGGNFGGGHGGKGILGDKSSMAGTDSDIAIAYLNYKGEHCLWLIEHKLTEKEFTECGAYKSKGRRPRHDCTQRFSEIATNKNLCYYHDVRRFKYWELTEQHRNLFVQDNLHKNCPFKGGMNQLWRNQLLGLAIENSQDNPYQNVCFSVVKHPKNDALDATIASYKELIAYNPKFSVHNSDEFVSAAHAISDPELAKWVSWYRDLYQV
ncbi:MAG: hypothetical protein IH613_13300 [Desulfuromonadales bacterium]|nr:hypothetical protein [Desulfuromonadales bacterium]